jgi:hypothetical protein
MNHARGKGQSNQLIASNMIRPAIAKMTKLNTTLQVIATTIWVSVTLAAQKPTSNISVVGAAGEVDGGVYRNSYLAIILSATKAKLKVPEVVNVAGKRGRLVDVVYDSGDGALNYTIAVLADIRTGKRRAYPWHCLVLGELVRAAPDE